MKEIFNKYAAVVFFDTETTGLDERKDQIIELAALRIEQTPNETLQTTKYFDIFVKLPEGQQLPEKIVELTGITDEILETNGKSEAYAALQFADIIKNDKGPVLLIAHNAQFDLLFTRAMFDRQAGDGVEMFVAADYLDSLTVYKDRRAYPHKLANAINAYKLEDKVQNSHRAIDDVLALYEVCKAMSKERADFLNYVNIFGYNPKYGVTGYRLTGVKYWPQRFNNYMQAPNYTLPARCKRGDR